MFDIKVLAFTLRVKDLIQQLQKFDPDSLVLYDCSITTVLFNKEEDMQVRYVDEGQLCPHTGKYILN